MQPVLAAMARKAALSHGPDWHAAQKIENQQTLQEIERREAIAERERAEQKRKFERDLLEADRGRIGRERA